MIEEVWEHERWERKRNERSEVYENNPLPLCNGQQKKIAYFCIFFGANYSSFSVCTFSDSKDAVTYGPAVFPLHICRYGWRDFFDWGCVCHFTCFQIVDFFPSLRFLLVCANNCLVHQHWWGVLCSSDNYSIYLQYFKMADMEEARARMIAKRFGGKSGGASTGGGGSVRRKKKTAHKSTGGKFAWQGKLQKHSHRRRQTKHIYLLSMWWYHIHGHVCCEDWYTLAWWWSSLCFEALYLPALSVCLMVFPSFFISDYLASPLLSFCRWQEDHCCCQEAGCHPHCRHRRSEHVQKR